MPGHDPYSVPIATVAGTISTNGVGYRAGAYGPMGDQVVAMEVVLPDGRIITTRSVPNYSSGPNLNHLFIGSEGAFGVITRATIKVFRLPESQVFAAVDFESFDQGFRASAELHALGIRPTLLDLTEEEDRIRLYLLFEGFREGVTALEKRARQVCSEFGGRDLGPEPTLDYWSDATNRPKIISGPPWANRVRNAGTGAEPGASTTCTWDCPSARFWNTGDKRRKFYLPAGSGWSSTPSGAVPSFFP